MALNAEPHARAGMMSACRAEPEMVGKLGEMNGSSAGIGIQRFIYSSWNERLIVGVTLRCNIA
jgi:hypothetical protein